MINLNLKRKQNSAMRPFKQHKLGAAREETVGIKRFVNKAAMSLSAFLWAWLWASSVTFCSAASAAVSLHSLGHPCHPLCPDLALSSHPLWAVPLSFCSLEKPRGTFWKEPPPPDCGAHHKPGAGAGSIVGVMAGEGPMSPLWTLFCVSKVSGHPAHICLVFSKLF